MQKIVQKTEQICTAALSCVGMQPDWHAVDETMPLAIAHKLDEGSLFDAALPCGRAEGHLARLKQALLLYVNAVRRALMQSGTASTKTKLVHTQAKLVSLSAQPAEPTVMACRTDFSYTCALYILLLSIRAFAVPSGAR